ncbi:hypothetical protein [Bradyrhizobium sp.]|uniref:hypothetical protein n=1 Tax=Bradyrhizobium sp. TaxID=376 RepID=UPI00391D245C
MQATKILVREGAGPIVLIGPSGKLDAQGIQCLLGRKQPDGRVASDGGEIGHEHDVTG